MADATITAHIQIDCDNLTCIAFTDTTGAYSLSNTTGYNSPNAPSISAITQVRWILHDINGAHEFTTSDTDYFPNEIGDNEICLTAADFGIAAFVGGTDYELDYIVFVGIVEYSLMGIEILFPCCGASKVSNLGTNFTITEQQGCTSATLTDTTGTYDVDDNPGGYGTPNPAYADITETLITITKKDGTVVSITDFIPTEAVPFYTITSATLGYSDAAIPSQVMTVAYSVYTQGKCRVGYKEAKFFFRCALETCIRNRNIAALTSCDTTAIEYAFKLTWEYNQILIASQGIIGCVEDQIDKLVKKCSLDSFHC